MPTEEDLKAIIVHKKYSSSTRSKKDARKRKRSISSESSQSSNSSDHERKPDRKSEAKVNPDVGFVPSRFLKDRDRDRSSGRGSSSRRRDEDGGHKGRREARESKRERSHDKRDDRKDDRERREDRTKDDRHRDERSKERRIREERSREERVKEDRAREERVKEDRAREDKAREDKARDERAKEERSREARSREERSKEERSREDRRDERREDRGREERPVREDRVKEEKREGGRDDRRGAGEDRRPEDDRTRRDRDHERRDDRRDDKPASNYRKEPDRGYTDQYRLRREEEARRRGRDAGKPVGSPADGKRPRIKGREEDEDYDPISDEELAMLEEDAGIIEIYKELEREMRSKRYTANLDHVDFTALDILIPEKLESNVTKDPISRFAECGFSSTFGGKALTDKIKSLSLEKGIEAPLSGAYSANKKTVRSVFRETLSPHVALCSHTDTLLRQRINRLNNHKHVSQIILTEEPVNNTLLLESIKLFNQMAGTNLEVK